ncbi:MAG: SCP2 sterol-binding domain-containing protein [Actinomycetes bacterium]
MASVDEVERTIALLIGRLDRIDPAYRSMMPSKRLIEAECPDLGLTWHATWSHGELSEIEAGPAVRRPDIRLVVDSDDLIALADGELDFSRAYTSQRIRVHASMTDMLRLRAAL